MKENLKFKQLIETRRCKTKRNFIDKVLNLDEKINTLEQVETLYVGMRKGKSAFLRFYNKFIDVVEKAKNKRKIVFSDHTDMKLS